MANRLAGAPSASYWGIVKKTFKDRFLVAVVLMGGLFLAIQYLPDIGFFCVLQILIIISLLEFYKLFQGTKTPPYQILGLIMSLLISASFLFDAVTLEMVLFSSLFLAAAFPLVFLKRAETLAPFANAIALTLLGPLFVNFTLNHVYLLRLEKGAVYVYFLGIIIICGDTAAYFVGKFWGKHLLAPKASPRKTWEGTFGGFVFAGLGALFVQQVLIPDILLWKAVVVAVLVHVFAQIGDLFESLFKRAAGRKDSSNILAGHGGFLDRIDSFVLAAPFFYFILKIIRLN